MHVEVVEVLLEHLVDQLDQGAGDLDAGGPATDHDEVEHPVVDQRGLAVGRLEEGQEVVAHPDGVLEAVEREGVLLGAVDAEVVGRRTSGDDQVVEGHGALGGERDGVVVPVDADDVVLAEEHLLLARNTPRTT